MNRCCNIWSQRKCTSSKWHLIRLLSDASTSYRLLSHKHKPCFLHIFIETLLFVYQLSLCQFTFMFKNSIKFLSVAKRIICRNITNGLSQNKPMFQPQSKPNSTEKIKYIFPGSISQVYWGKIGRNFSVYNSSSFSFSPRWTTFRCVAHSDMNARVNNIARKSTA